MNPLRLARIKPAIDAALALLPPGMDTPEARVLLNAIGLQESRFTARKQAGGGPARGFWQFEQGTPATRGGITGVCLHRIAGPYARDLAQKLGHEFDPRRLWQGVETDDVLAAGMARLLLLTDARRLPAVSDAQGAWECYAERTWRPGKPHPETWPAFHQEARCFVAP